MAILTTDDFEAHILRHALSDYIEHEADVAYEYRNQGDLPAADELDANVDAAKALLARLEDKGENSLWWWPPRYIERGVS